MQVIAIAALSVDGCIAQETNQVSTKWTSKADAQWFTQKTTDVQYCVMGKTTYATFNRPLKYRTLLILSKQAEKRLAADQLSPGNVIEVGYSPVELCERLRELGVTQLAVCGGASIYTQFLQAGLVDRLYLTVEPKLFGQGVHFGNAPLATDLTLQQVRHLSDQTIVLEYEVVKERREG